MFGFYCMKILIEITARDVQTQFSVFDCFYS